MLYELYLRRHDRVNNWDLVDRAAPHVVGGYLMERDRKPLYKLARSRDPWERCAAMPRPMLRLAVEKLDKSLKSRFAAPSR